MRQLPSPLLSQFEIQFNFQFRNWYSKTTLHLGHVAQEPELAFEEGGCHHRSHATGAFCRRPVVTSAIVCSLHVREEGHDTGEGTIGGDFVGRKFHVGKVGFQIAKLNTQHPGDSAKFPTH